MELISGIVRREGGSEVELQSFQYECCALEHHFQENGGIGSIRGRAHLRCPCRQSRDPTALVQSPPNCIEGSRSSSSSGLSHSDPPPSHR